MTLTSSFRSRWWMVLLIVAGAGALTCRRQESVPLREGPRILGTRPANEQPCPHPLLPLIPGARWTYRLGEPSNPRRTSTVLEVETVATQANRTVARIRRTVGSTVTTVEASCDAQGVSFLALFLPLGPPLDASLAAAPFVTQREGTLLPVLRHLRPNARWAYGLVARTARPGSPPLTIDSQWRVTAEGLEPGEAVVPAGHYHTTRVRYTMTAHHRPPQEKHLILSDRVMDPPPMTFVYSFAEGVGVVLIAGEPQPDRPQVRPRWELEQLSRRSGPMQK